MAQTKRVVPESNLEPNLEFNLTPKFTGTPRALIPFSTPLFHKICSYRWRFFVDSF